MENQRRRLLVVDDDPGIRDVVRAYATRDGFTVEEAADGEAAERLVLAGPPIDLVVLDLMIPVIDGWELCRRWRAAGGPPVIMLTARGAESERILGLGLGADDYLTKPFSPLELMARIQAVLRRAGTSRSPAATDLTGRLQFGDLTVEVARRRISCGERALPLTRGQFDLLAALAYAGDSVSSRLDLLQVLGEGEVAATDRAVDQHMVALRRALAEVGSRCRVATIRGVGYRLEAG